MDFDDLPQADVNRPPMVRPPIQMILFCPACGFQHVDEAKGDWINPPHKSHLCLKCNHIWRPADVPTEGVWSIYTSGAADSPIVKRQAFIRASTE